MRRVTSKIICAAGVVVAVLFVFWLFRRNPKMLLAAWAHVRPHVGEISAAALGALFGSLSAFYLGRVQQRRDRFDKNHEALLATQYAMQSQWNTLEGIRQQLLEKLREDPLRHTKLPIFPIIGSPTFAPLSDLVFIAKIDDPDLLQEIRIAEEGYRTCVHSLAVRNQLWEQLQRHPHTKHHDFNPETGSSILEADRCEIYLVKQITDALYASIDSSLPRLLKVFEAVGGCIKRNFRNSQMLQMKSR